jgi:hypothetical protein
VSARHPGAGFSAGPQAAGRPTSAAATAADQPAGRRRFSHSSAYAAAPSDADIADALRLRACARVLAGHVTHPLMKVACSKSSADRETPLIQLRKRGIPDVRACKRKCMQRDLSR